MRRVRSLFFAAALCVSCAPSSAPKSVLLITLDTTRADRIGCYGRPNAGTDNIDALAARGLFFERALTPVPLTLPAHASLMTASPPPYHGVRDNGLFVVDERLETLAERLRAEGLTTAAFISAFPLESQFGLDQGFAVYDEQSLSSVSAETMHERRGDEVVSSALAWLGNLEDDEPFFLWVHLFDPHFPYAPPAPFDERFRGDAYQGEIAFADSQVGRLFEALDRAGRTDSTLVAVTADHGESLGEFGEVSHGHLLYDGTQHIPMVLAGPGVPAVGAVGGSVGLVDLAPTLLELLGLEPGAFTSHGGRSLAADLASAQVPAAPVYLESIYPRLHDGWSELYGIESAGWKYVVAPGAQSEDGAPAAELFDLRSGETRDLIATEPARAAKLAAMLTGLRKSLTAAPPFASRPGLTSDGSGSDALAALESLGYVGLDLEAVATDLPGLDPRRVIHAAVAANHLRSYLERKDLVHADAKLTEIEALDPDGILAAESRALLALARGDLDAALLSLTRATDLAPGRRGLWQRRAEVERSKGDLVAALQSAHKAYTLAPPTERIKVLWSQLEREAEASQDIEVQAAFHALEEATQSSSSPPR